MKIFSRTGLGVCIIYFILRIIYEISKIKIIYDISSLISMIVGIVAFIVSLILFFYGKNKKDSIQLFIISIILIFVNIIDYLF